MRRTWYLAAALATVYVAWGSTFLGIKVALESLPPFLLVGLRFLAAGTVLYVLARLRGEAPCDLRSWKEAGVLAALLLVCGAGAVAWAEQWVPSGLAALLGASSPLWVAVLDRGRERSSAAVLGLLAGFSGVALLVGSSFGDGRAVSLAAVGALLLSALAWAFGSLRSRRSPGSDAMRAGSQMLLAGLVLCGLGALAGEEIHLARVTLRSAGALLYLTAVGSVMAFSAFTWLSRNCPPSLVSTHAYVNPVVAVSLGATLGGESLTPATLLAAGLALSGVALMLVGERVQGRPRRPTAMAPLRRAA